MYNNLHNLQKNLWNDKLQTSYTVTKKTIQKNFLHKSCLEHQFAELTICKSVNSRPQLINSELALIPELVFANSSLYQFSKAPSAHL